MADRKLTMAELEDRLRVGVMRGMFRWGQHAKQLAQNSAPVKTSRLAAEIDVDQMGAEEIERGRYRIKIGVKGLEYARAHEYGSGIHAQDPAQRRLIPITAGFWTGKSQAKSLWFEWPGGPRDHPAYNAEHDKFAFHTVYHPGVPAANQGQGYLRKGAIESRDIGLQLVIESLKAALSR